MDLRKLFKLDHIEQATVDPALLSDWRLDLADAIISNLKTNPANVGILLDARIAGALANELIEWSFITKKRQSGGDPDGL